MQPEQGPSPPSPKASLAPDPGHAWLDDVVPPHAKPVPPQMMPKMSRRRTEAINLLKPKMMPKASVPKMMPRQPTEAPPEHIIERFSKKHRKGE